MSTSTLQRPSGQAKVGPSIRDEIASLWHSLLRDLFDAPARALLPVRERHYRPERHYMRGPGPKWTEKHGAPGPY